MISKNQFELQQKLAQEAREYLESKLAQTPEDDASRRERITQAAAYCLDCENASNTILELLAEDEDAEKKTKEGPKKQRAKKVKEEPKDDGLEDLF